MKLISRYTLLLLLTGLSLVGVVSCTDDFDFNGNAPIDMTGQEVSVQLAVDFNPMAEAVLQSRATHFGTTLSDVRDLCLVIFDKDGKYYDYRTFSSLPKDTEHRDPQNASNGSLAGETITRHMTVECKLPVGSYYLYALANMGSDTKAFIESSGLSVGETDIEDFAALRQSWDIDMAKNGAMTGYFTNGKQENGPATVTPEELKANSEKSATPKNLVTVRSTGGQLHCWLRRMASKVTIDFDASGLSSDVYVYLRDVRIYNLANDCNLFGPNTAGNNAEDANLAGILAQNNNDQILLFCNDSDKGDPAQLSSIKDNFRKWPCLTSTASSFEKIKDDYPHVAQFTHDNDAPSLFFFENMQGKGDSKLQDAYDNTTLDGEKTPVQTPDGQIDYPNGNTPGTTDYRDGKYYGTYIEVTAYYVSENLLKPGNGTIKYRFMLGKDVFNDYNAERNFHYKLTLCLKGYANEVDWHIEYNYQEEPVVVPQTFYVSYAYNQEFMLPVVVNGEVLEAKAAIVRNDWEPSFPGEDRKPGEDVYYNGGLDEPYVGTFKDDKETDKDLKVLEFNNKDALGFLSLIKSNYDGIGVQRSSATDNDAHTARTSGYWYLEQYWKGNGDVNAGVYISGSWSQNEKRNPHYKRIYSNLDSGTHDTEAEGCRDGAYTVTVTPGTPYPTTRIDIPLYTRERNLVKTTGLSGSNPYEGYQRRAKIKLIFKVQRGDAVATVEKDVDIIQVERVTNPTGVWRSWNNARPFRATLTTINGMNALSYQPLISEGSWSAEVEIGADWILLNGNRENVYGDGGSAVDFTISPIGILSDPNSVRCGVVKVKYHNYSCVHRILVRQGYAPLAVNEGDAKWHSYNLVSVTGSDEMGWTSNEETSPLAEGSMFRFGNLDQAISSSNSRNDKYPWINVKSSDFQLHPTVTVVSGTTEKEEAWKNITSRSIIVHGDENYDDVVPFPNNRRLDNSSAKTRMMDVWDIISLRDNPDNSFVFGICYGDGAFGSEMNIDYAYGFRGDNNSPSTYGMRGVFAFNHNNGNQVFFPIGVAGFGCRQFRTDRINWTTDLVNSKLKYGGPDDPISDRITRRPMFKFLYRSSGAIYWAANYYSSRAKKYTGRVDPDKAALGMDINYETYDFNTISAPNIQSTNDHENGVSHACFIRLVDGDRDSKAPQ